MMLLQAVHDSRLIVIFKGGVELRRDIVSHVKSVSLREIFV